jgi:hypothetical protein
VSAQLKIKDSRASPAKKAKVRGASLWDERKRMPGSRAFTVLAGPEAPGATVQRDDAAAQESDASAETVAETRDIDAAEGKPSDPRLARLADAAAAASAPLPEQLALQSTLGASLDGVRTTTGPMARAALDGIDAEAATIGNVIVLRDEAPDRETLVHEAVHVLQARDDPGAAPADVAPAGSAAELEAADLARRIEEAMREGRSLSALPRARLQPGVVHRRDLDHESRLSDKEAEERFRAARDAPASGEQAQADAGNTQAAAAPVSPEGSSVLGTQPAADLTPTNEPDFQPPAPPDVSLTPEQKAARDAEMAKATAAIEGADDVDALMGGFADAPPSIKARMQGSLATRADGIAQKESQSFDQSLPPFNAQMSGDVAVEAPPPLLPAGTRAQDNVEGQVAPAPEPDIAPTAPVTSFDTNDSIPAWFARWFDLDPAKAVGDSIRDVKTSDQEVETSPGAPPEVPLEGETDPKRVDEQQAARRDEAKAARDEETRKVVDGRGPEASQPQALDQAFAAVPEVTPQLEGASPVPGADAFVGYNLPEEVEAAVDAKQGETMRASLDGARTSIDEGVKTRDLDREAAIADAEKKRKDLNEAADAEQVRAVTQARSDIQAARQDSVDQQSKAVETLEADAERERGVATTEIDGQVKDTERQVVTKYDQAERESNREVTKADEEAAEEKRKAEREAENMSWWERAKSWVKSALKALTDLVGKIFDAVRSLVKGILDAVKSVVKGLIDLAAKAIKAAIHAFGAILKGLVTTLLGDIFPGLAKALNDKIDSAVEAADKLVDKAADALKKGVDALVDFVGKVLDKIILAYQTVVSAGLALAYGAITGDWSEAARIVLEPLLELLGIDKEEFYGYVGRASETISKIVDDPGGFVGNLWEAFKTGVGWFRDNFFEHLKNGVITWLSGAIGEFTMPKNFDVLGILDLGRQVMGLTLDTLRRIAVRVFGEKAVAMVEFVVGELVILIQGGWAALWERITSAFGDLVDLVLNALKEFVVTRLIMAAIEKLASLFTPIGAIVQLVMTIWNIVMFLKDQFDRIVSVLKAIVDTVTDIANGVLDKAAKGVEMALANALPVAIDLVAKLARLGGIPGKIREVLGSIRQRVEDAIVNLVKKIGQGFKSFFKGKGGAEAAPGEALPVAGGAPAVEVGETLEVAAPGGAHTLWFAVQGRDAELMLSSTPTPLWQVLIDLGKVAEALPVNDEAAKKKRSAVMADVKTAKDMRVALDKEADTHTAAAVDAQTPKTAAAPAKPAAQAGSAKGSAPKGVPNDAAIDKKEESLRDVLVRIYGALGNPAGAALLEKFKTQIDALHPDAKTTVLELLNLEQAKIADADWAAVEKLLRADAPLFLKPLLATGPGKYPAALRAAIIALITDATDEKGFDGVRAGADAFLSNNYLAKLHSAEGDVYGPALAAIQNGLLRNEAVATTAARLKSSLLMAAKGATAGEPDPELKAIGGPAVPDFLENMAEQKDYGKLAASEWTPRWWGKPENQDWIRDKFRLGGGQHEWIPTNYVGEVVARAQQELAPGHDANGARNGAGAAVRWVRFQNRFRSPTDLIIYKPDGPALREISGYQGPKGVVSKVAVLQGHVGAVYAPVKETGYLPQPVPGKDDPSRIKPQTQYQGPWHDQLRIIFDSNKGKAGEVEAVPRILTEVLKFYTDTVWDGSGSIQGNGPDAFDEYYNSTGGRLSFAALVGKAAQTKSDRTRLAKVIDGLGDEKG